MTGMRLISEYDKVAEYLTEDHGGKRYSFLQGVFMESDCVNRNGRYYEHKVLGPEVNRYINEQVKENRAWGELGHPEKPTINLDRTCIIIKDISESKNQFIGKAQICETPMGHVVRGLLESGGRLGVSSRALGSLTEHQNGYKLVAPDLKLLAVDVVADPSAPNAYVDGIMENCEWIFEAAQGWIKKEIVKEAVAEQKAEVAKMNIQQINENKVRLFEDYLKTLLT